MSINERIKEIIDLRFDGKSARLAKYLDVGPGTLGNIVSSRMSKPGHDILDKLINSDLNVDANWLFTGLGKPFRDNNEVDESGIFNSVVNENGIEYDDINETTEFTNSNGNKFYILPNGKIKIEVLKIPYKAYASYVEAYYDEVKQLEEFEKVLFTVDHLGKGNYLGFESEGDSMNGGGIDDVPDGAEMLGREVGKQYWRTLHKTKHGLIFITKNGMWHKDFGGYNEDTGEFLLLSRNKRNKPFSYPINDVVQIFNVIKRHM